jgi:hypothetical protein
VPDTIELDSRVVKVCAGEAIAAAIQSTKTAQVLLHPPDFHRVCLTLLLGPRAEAAALFGTQHRFSRVIAVLQETASRRGIRKRLTAQEFDLESRDCQCKPFDGSSVASWVMVGKGKRPRDTNQLAKWIVDQSTGQLPDPNEGKNPAAVALGRLGGLKGGKARATSLSSRKRRAIAEKAAKARWGKK